ncbi:hypothetical protein [Tellurirhabdus rosea]|nr:hypothetical protein [Tellurirhabdus rosea]
MKKTIASQTASIRLNRATVSQFGRDNQLSRALRAEHRNMISVTVISTLF